MPLRDSASSSELCKKLQGILSSASRCWLILMRLIVNEGEDAQILFSVNGRNLSAKQLLARFSAEHFDIFPSIMYPGAKLVTMMWSQLLPTENFASVFRALASSCVLKELDYSIKYGLFVNSAVNLRPMLVSISVELMHLIIIFYKTSRWRNCKELNRATHYRL